jgi:flagellar M-ring protein FliF
MNELLQRIRERLAQVNARLTTVQKVTIVVVALLLVGAISTLAWLGTRTEYAVLYSELKQDDAGRIADKLKEEKVDFKVDKGGSTILVPAERADELRIMLAADGPIDANLGYRLLDRGDTFGMPEEILKVNRQRALEGELAKSIESLDEVKTARVHLALAEQELFVEDQKNSTASVVVTLLPGSSLRPKQVKGIVNLVAGAVTGLDADNVTIINESGKVLRPANEEQLGEMQRNVEYQRNIEKELEQKATEVLERAVGRGKAVVRVRARMDFTKEQRTEELYDPKQQVARSEENLTESRQNGADRVGGAAGANANDPNVAQGVIRVGDASNSNREKQTVNYEISKVTKQVLVPELKLSRVSVAVLVDGTYKAGGATGEGGAPASGEAQAAKDGVAEKVYVGRSKEEIETIKNLVAKAVELDLERGDQIEVASMQFQDDTLEEVAVIKAVERQALIDKTVKYGLILLVFLLLVFVVFRPVVRWLTAPPPPVETAEMVEEGALPEPELSSLLPGDEVMAQIAHEDLPVAEKIRQFVEKDPEVAASVLRYWLRPRQTV